MRFLHVVLPPLPHLAARVVRTSSPGNLFSLHTAKMASRRAYLTAKTTPKRLQMAQDGSRGSASGLTAV
eukprot:7719212-Pyramimonas_sp.AAC.1